MSGHALPLGMKAELQSSALEQIAELRGEIRGLRAQINFLSTHRGLWEMERRKLFVRRPEVQARIVDLVCEHYGFSRRQFYSRRRWTRLVECRHFGVLMLYRAMGLNFSDLGRLMGMDHGTMRNAVRQAQDRIESNPVARGNFERLQAQLGNAEGRTMNAERQGVAA